MRKDILEASKEKEQGGIGVAKEFWEWSEQQVKEYL